MTVSVSLWMFNHKPLLWHYDKVCVSNTQLFCHSLSIKWSILIGNLSCCYVTPSNNWNERQVKRWYRETSQFHNSHRNLYCAQFVSLWMDKYSKRRIIVVTCAFDQLDNFLWRCAVIDSFLFFFFFFFNFHCIYFVKTCNTINLVWLKKCNRKDDYLQIRKWLTWSIHLAPFCRRSGSYLNESDPSWHATVIVQCLQALIVLLIVSGFFDSPKK